MKDLVFLFLFFPSKRIRASSPLEEEKVAISEFPSSPSSLLEIR